MHPMVFLYEIFLNPFTLLQAQQQNHEQQMQSLRLKAKDEAIQAAKDLEKVRTVVGKM